MVVLPEGDPDGTALAMGGTAGTEPAREGGTMKGMRRRAMLAAVLAAGCLSGGCSAKGFPMPFDNQAYNDYRREHNGAAPYHGQRDGGADLIVLATPMLFGF